MAAERRWTITVAGRTYENVLGLRFTPKVRHVRGGRMPINVTVSMTANNVLVGSVQGTITYEGQMITMSSIDWYPTAPGTYTLVFRAQAVDVDGRTGSAQTSLVATVEEYVGAPEIEIIVELA